MEICNENGVPLESKISLGVQNSSDTKNSQTRMEVMVCCNNKYVRLYIWVKWKWYFQSASKPWLETVMVRLTPEEFETGHLKFRVTEGKSERLAYLKLLVRKDMRSPVPDGEHEILVYKQNDVTSGDTSYLQLLDCQCKACNTSNKSKRKDYDGDDL